MGIRCYNQTSNAHKEVSTMSEYKYKYNAKKTAYDVNYVKEHYDRMEVRLPKGYREKVKEHVKANNTNVNVWLKELIDKELGL